MRRAREWWDALAGLDELVLVIVFGWAVAFLLLELPPQGEDGGYVHFGEEPTVDTLATGVVFEPWAFALVVVLLVVGGWLIVRPLLVRPPGWSWPPTARCPRPSSVGRGGTRCWPARSW